MPEFPPASSGAGGGGLMGGLVHRHDEVDPRHEALDAERLRASIARHRIAAGLQLAHEAVQGLGGLHQVINQVTAKNPGLETELWGFGEAISRGVANIITDYMSGQ